MVSTMNVWWGVYAAAPCLFIIIYNYNACEQLWESVNNNCLH